MKLTAFLLGTKGFSLDACSWLPAASTTCPCGFLSLSRSEVPSAWLNFHIAHCRLTAHSAPRPLLADPTDGLPDYDDAIELHRIEEDLTAALGPRGLLVATQTSNGRRILHCYTDFEDQNGRDIIDRFAGIRPRAEVARTQRPRMDPDQPFHLTADPERRKCLVKAPNRNASGRL